MVVICDKFEFPTDEFGVAAEVSIPGLEGWLVSMPSLSESSPGLLPPGKIWLWISINIPVLSSSSVTAEVFVWQVESLSDRIGVLPTSAVLRSPSSFLSNSATLPDLCNISQDSPQISTTYVLEIFGLRGLGFLAAGTHFCPDFKHLWRHLDFCFPRGYESSLLTFSLNLTGIAPSLFELAVFTGDWISESWSWWLGFHFHMCSSQERRPVDLGARRKLSSWCSPKRKLTCYGSGSQEVCDFRCR